MVSDTEFNRRQKAAGQQCKLPPKFLPSCTIVICTRNRPFELDRCLAAIARLSYPNFDVLVVDNASHDSQTSDIAKQWGVRYLLAPVPGLSRARNVGAHACESEIVVFVDDDAVPERDWLTALACEFEDPRMMAVAGRTLPLGTPEFPQESNSEKSPQPPIQRRVLDRETPLWFEISNFGGIGRGLNMAFRRRIFDTWPGFYERLGRGTLLGGSEEHYAFFTLVDRGYRVAYTADAVAHHPSPPTRRALFNKQIKDLAGATAYFTLLFVEQPRYRRAVINYVAGALRGTPRTWRIPAAPPPRVVPKWCAPFACLAGPLLYIASRLIERADMAGFSTESGEVPAVPIREENAPASQYEVLGPAPLPSQVPGD